MQSGGMFTNLNVERKYLSSEGLKMITYSPRDLVNSFDTQLNIDIDNTREKFGNI